MNETIYNSRMKMADLVAADISLLSILQRLGLKLGFGEATVGEVCSRCGISVDLFIIICNIYSFSDYEPNVASLGREDAVNITAYLRASHRYYTTVCFPSLHAKIHSLVKQLDDVSRRLIDKFFDDYDSEVCNHFKYEEEVVFPYIEQQLSGNSVQEYRISLFGNTHGNVNEKLSDLGSIIVKYLDENSTSQLHFDIVNEIHAINRDLQKHSHIENKLLIPLVEKLEAQYE
ncbi:MAG: hemerythrin domain-containing protein [Bacteroidaceae bacterium]|nr:hemerythrin domain-containing protein [Bacteroidaceae bacterium]